MGKATREILQGGGLTVDLRRGKAVAVMRGGYALLTKLVQLSASTVPANAVLYTDAIPVLYSDAVYVIYV